jgi:hypothetical protein
MNTVLQSANSDNHNSVSNISTQEVFALHTFWIQTFIITETFAL